MNQSKTAAGGAKGKSPAHMVGFSVMTSGSGESAQACVIAPYAGEISKVDVVGDSVVLDLGHSQVTLRPIPDDLAKLVKASPQNVMFVTVDTLSRVRQATTFGATASH